MWRVCVFVFVFVCLLYKQTFLFVCFCIGLYACVQAGDRVGF